MINIWGHGTHILILSIYFNFILTNRTSTIDLFMHFGGNVCQVFVQFFTAIFATFCLIMYKIFLFVLDPTSVSSIHDDFIKFLLIILQSNFFIFIILKIKIPCTSHTDFLDWQFKFTLKLLLSIWKIVFKLPLEFMMSFVLELGTQHYK